MKKSTNITVDFLLLYSVTMWFIAEVSNGDWKQVAMGSIFFITSKCGLDTFLPEV